MSAPTRRKVLAGALALGLAPRAGLAGEAPETLTAAPSDVQLVPEGGPATPVWCYEGAVPGPVLRLRRGESFARRLVNGLGTPTTVHWHGLRLPNAMDGVPGLTQPAVPPGGSFDYAFPLRDAGTFWYHPHVRSWEQVARGLSGALVVAEPGDPQQDIDEVLVLDDWRLGRDGHIDEASFGSMHDRAHGGRIGNWITANGKGEWRRRVRSRERMRLRLVNAATARIFDLGLRGLAGWVVALDGQPLETPKEAGRFRLAPAQRVDLVLDVTAGPGGEGVLVSFERDGGYALAGFPVLGSARDERLGAPSPLPPNEVPPLGDLANARQTELVMEGGAMGRLEGAMLGGERKDIRGLVAEGKAWALNGRADPPEAPLLTAGIGETVAIRIRNETRWPHAMHLHGHHFRRIDGAAPGPLRDTMLVDRDETITIAFAAETPGSWLLHCHMLDHAAAGMSTWVKVEG